MNMETKFIDPNYVDDGDISSNIMDNSLDS
jgi:hypothetical protein